MKPPPTIIEQMFADHGIRVIDVTPKENSGKSGYFALPVEKYNLDPVREQKIKRMIEIGESFFDYPNLEFDDECRLNDEWNTLKSELYGGVKPE